MTSYHYIMVWQIPAKSHEITKLSKESNFDIFTFLVYLAWNSVCLIQPMQLVFICVFREIRHHFVSSFPQCFNSIKCVSLLLYLCYRETSYKPVSLRYFHFWQSCKALEKYHRFIIPYITVIITQLNVSNIRRASLWNANDQWLMTYLCSLQ